MRSRLKSALQRDNNSMEPYIAYNANITFRLHVKVLYNTFMVRICRVRCPSSSFMFHFEWNCRTCVIKMHLLLPPANRAISKSGPSTVLLDAEQVVYSGLISLSLKAAACHAAHTSLTHC